MTIGCDRLYVALLTTDSDSELTYSTPIRFPGLMKIGITPNSSNATAFYDNGPGETASTMGAIELSIDKSALSTVEEAMLLGKMIDANGAIISSADDTPPDVAVGFRTLKANGKYKYCWLLKGSFSEPEAEVETKGESVSFQATSLKANFVKVSKEFSVTGKDHAGKDVTKKVTPWKVALDEEHTDASEAVADAWFSKVYTPGAAVPTSAAALAE